MQRLAQLGKPRKSFPGAYSTQLHLFPQQFKRGLTLRATFWCMSHAIEKKLQKLPKQMDFTTVERLVLWVLNSYVYKGKVSCHPGVAALMESTGLNESSVYRVLGSLSKKGAISRAGVGGFKKTS
jgi:hypothetical protein